MNLRDAQYNFVIAGREDLVLAMGQMPNLSSLSRLGGVRAQVLHLPFKLTDADRA